MSDLEHPLEATSQEELDARLGPWTSKVLRKWRTVGLNEREGWELLTVWAQVNAPTFTLRLHKMKKRFERTTHLHGLLAAALHYGKDPRTIRRWCEKGFFPSAHRSKRKGGHWRIPFTAIGEAQSRLPNGYARRPKNIFGTKVWREFKAEARELFGDLLAGAVEIESALKNRSQAELKSALKSKDKCLLPSEPALDVLAAARASEKLDFARLCALACRLYLDDPHLNASQLAKELGISTATIYRRFKASQIRGAIRAAAQPLREEKDTTLDSDRDVNEIHSDLRQEFTPSPAIATGNGLDGRHWKHH